MSQINQNRALSGSVSCRLWSEVFIVYTVQTLGLRLQSIGRCRTKLFNWFVSVILSIPFLTEYLGLLYWLSLALHIVRNVWTVEPRRICAYVLDVRRTDVSADTFLFVLKILLYCIIFSHVFHHYFSLPACRMLPIKILATENVFVHVNISTVIFFQ